MSDTIVIVRSKPVDEVDESKEIIIKPDWELVGAFCTDDNIPDHICKQKGNSITITKLHLDQGRTEYFRELKYCIDCSGDFITDTNVIYVVEVKHGQTDEDWHFEAMYPEEDLAKLHTKKTLEASRSKGESVVSRRIYTAILPYPRDTFAESVNRDNDKTSKTKSVKSQNKITEEKRTKTAQRDIEQIKINTNRIILLVIFTLITNILVLALG